MLLNASLTFLIKPVTLAIYHNGSFTIEILMNPTEILSMGIMFPTPLNSKINYQLAWVCSYLCSYF